MKRVLLEWSEMKEIKFECNKCVWIASFQVEAHFKLTINSAISFIADRFFAILCIIYFYANLVNLFRYTIFTMVNIMILIMQNED